MRDYVAALTVAACVLCASSSSHAGGTGRFLGALLARGAVAGVVAGTSSSSAKTYAADTLTVSQLAQCIKRAAKLDDDGTQLETSRTALQAAIDQTDQSKATVEQQRANLNRSSRSAVNSFNALVDRHNVLLTDVKAKQTDFNTSIDAHNVEVDAYNRDCAKKYYADDLAEAKKQAGVTGG